jgi:pimeloyl-ACP methyl ester carboxylesterase
MEILNSKIFGENLTATPLLVFHGLFGMLDNWGSFGKDLGEYLPVHLIDLRNHGRSFHSEGCLTMIWQTILPVIWIIMEFRKPMF